MLNKTSAYSVSPKELLDLSTGRQKEEFLRGEENSEEEEPCSKPQCSNQGRSP